jgi:hypothetical protein
MAVQLALGPANRGFTVSFERLAENTPEMLGSFTGHLAGAISLVIVKRLETLNEKMVKSISNTCGFGFGGLRG